MANFVKSKLGQILLDEGKVTLSDLESAIAIQKSEGKKMSQVLVEKEIVSEESMVDAISKEIGVEKIDLAEVKIDKKVLKLVSQNLCKKYNLIPFEIDGKKIKVALADPLNIFAIDDVRIVTGMKVETYIATKTQINKCIEVNYSKQQLNKAAEDLLKETMSSKNQDADVEELDDVKNAPVVKMVDQIFKNAIEMRTSDIHIEPYEDEIRIRYRIDGKLHLINTLSIESLAPLVTRIKILANLNIAEKRIPQDGKIITRVDGTDVDLRVSILPIVNGEKIVIRILKREGYTTDKKKLGMNEENLRKLEKLISAPNGIILVTGPTGSGKSTTLYTVLSELNTDDVNIVTVEDPVEYSLSGINQVNVNSKAGMTFASGLRSILRQDPDIIMIGEIRDNETAEIAIKAAITGHLVLSTLHTNDAPSSISRLLDMGIEPYLVSTSLVGVIAQRLVRRICPNCKEEYEASEKEKKILHKDIDMPLKLYRGKGCGHCNKTGYYGRAGIYEIMEVTREHRDAMNTTRNMDTFRDISLRHGMTTLEDECIKLVLNGTTTVEELATISLMKEDM